MQDKIKNIKSSPVIKRYSGNPVLSWKDVPYHATLTYNAGVTRFAGKYVMVFRNDYGSFEDKRQDGTNLGLAYSNDGLNWDVMPKPIVVLEGENIKRVYDPRLTVIEDRCYICFAVDLIGGGVCGGIAVTDDLENFEVLNLTTPDNRNLVLFPERVGGRYIRLERPFSRYGRDEIDRFDLWISRSPDMRYWGDSELMLKAGDVPFANDKIGPGAPPVKTPQGWLVIFHAVHTDPDIVPNGWYGDWRKRYMCGVMLLDLEDPRKIIGFSRKPLLFPEASYEISGGMRNNVLFPTGVILEDSGEVKIYYGAADTTQCLATADVGDLLELCEKI